MCAERRRYMILENRAPRKRPFWVWLISIFYALSFVYSLLSLYIAFSGSIPLTPEVKAYFASLTRFDWALAVTQGVVTLSAAIALFLLRKAAYYLFCGAVTIALVTTVWQTLARPWLTALGSMRGATTGAVLGLGIILAVFLYSRKLMKEGRLT
jgi:hypothetical protein